MKSSEHYAPRLTRDAFRDGAERQSNRASAYGRMLSQNDERNVCLGHCIDATNVATLGRNGARVATRTKNALPVELIAAVPKSASGKLATAPWRSAVEQ